MLDTRIWSRTMRLTLNSEDERIAVRVCWDSLRLDTYSISRRLGVEEAEIEREIHRVLDRRIANRLELS